jgi:hypothetical protein
MRPAADGSFTLPVLALSLGEGWIR